MSPSFTHSARCLAGTAAQLLGWSPDIFWKATPADLALSLGSQSGANDAPTIEQIRTMMERDANG